MQLKLATLQTVTVGNSYLPQFNTKDSESNFDEVLEEIYEIIVKYNPSGPVVWCGNLTHPSIDTVQTKMIRS